MSMTMAELWTAAGSVDAVWVVIIFFRGACFAVDFWAIPWGPSIHVTASKTRVDANAFVLFIWGHRFFARFEQADCSKGTESNPNPAQRHLS